MSTVDTGFSVKPSAPASRSYSSGSIRPSPRDSSTSAATSSRVYVELTSSMIRTPNSRRIAEAQALITRMTGRRTVTIAQMGGPSTSAARSGPASARFLGIISPRTTCR